MAPGSAFVVMLTGALTVIRRAFESDRFTESVTFAVKSYAPAVVGAPEIAPLPASVRPGGKDPLATDHAYGGVPPLAARVCEYAVTAVPAGRDPVVMLGGVAAGLIVICRAFEADRFTESVTFAVKSYAPTVVGVPVIAPLAASVRPGGNDPLPMDHAYGGAPPVAARVCAYAVAAVPGGSEPVVIFGGVGAGLMVICRAFEVDRLAESVTLAVKSYAPAVVGVPEIAPLPASVRPGGKDPLATDHAYGGAPPVAAKVCE
jgi:hypothetical protein